MTTARSLRLFGTGGGLWLLAVATTSLTGCGCQLGDCERAAVGLAVALLLWRGPLRQRL